MTDEQNGTVAASAADRLLDLANGHYINVVGGLIEQHQIHWGREAGPDVQELDLAAGEL
jgi:hypothetical protein